jgi:hypothetical protein
MKKSWAVEWVKALRSGDYKQGRPGIMVDPEGGYCCLGVLQELTGRVRENNALLSLEACVETGMRTGVGSWHNKYGRCALSEMNDSGRVRSGAKGTKRAPLGRRFTFPEIADWIEKHYKVL